MSAQRFEGEALALRSREAAKALGISPRLLWQLTKDGAIPALRVGKGKRKIVLYPVDQLRKWLETEAYVAQLTRQGRVGSDSLSQWAARAIRPWEARAEYDSSRPDEACDPGDEFCGDQEGGYDE